MKSLVKLLLVSGALFAAVCGLYRGQMRQELLLRAAMRGDVKTIDALLRAGSDPNSEISDRHEYDRPLLMAAGHGHTEAVRLLIDRGAQINLAQDDGRTALIAAVEGGHTETASLLLARGADANAAYAQGSALTIAFEKTRGFCAPNCAKAAKLIELLRQYGAKDYAGVQTPALSLTAPPQTRGEP